MSAPPIPNTTCLLAFAIGIGVIFLAYWAVGFFSRWLLAKSRISERTAKEEGVPVWITGNFERNPKRGQGGSIYCSLGCLVRPLDRTLVLERFSPSAAQPRLQILSGKVKTDV